MPCQCLTGLWLVVIVPMRVVPATTAGHLRCSEPEKKKVLLAHLLRHFDGRAIGSTEGQRAVHHESHVASAAGFVAGGL